MAKKYRITDAEAAKVLIKNVNDRPNALATYGEAKMTPTQVKDLFDRQFMLVKEKHEALADAFEKNEETVKENTEKIEELENKLDNINAEETDPTVPAWAKQPNKPDYTADEVGAAEYYWVLETFSGIQLAINENGRKINDVSDEANRQYVILQISLSELTERLNAVANSSDVDLDQLAEIVAYIKSNKGLIDAITTSKVNITDIVDNLLTDVSNKPLSARMGLELKRMIDKIQVPDSNIPEWALQPEKPSYSKGEVGLGNVDNVRQYSESNPPPYPVTSVNGQAGDVRLGAEDVGAMPVGTKIPAKTSDITNDSGFITKVVSDLANYYTKSQTFTRDEINAKISAIPKFAIEVVSSLPTSNISATTVYLVGGGSGNDLYTEYIYANGKWEILGAQTVDLTGYATETWVNTQLGAYLKQSELEAAINTALATAKASGEFDGADGERGTGILKVSTSPASYTTATAGINPIKRMSISTIKKESGVSEVLVGDCISYSYYLYHIYYVDATYAYMDKYQSIRGDTGAAGKDYVLTDADKAEIAVIVEDNAKGEIIQSIVAELQTFPVFGYIDENNAITVTSLLLDGTYTLKYENEDGTKTEIGTIIVGTGTGEGSGGDYTPTYVNIISTAKTPTDLTTVFNDGKGYMDGKYASSSSPYYGDDSATFVTGLLESAPDSVFYIKGVTIDTSNSHNRLAVFSETGGINAAKPFTQMTDYATLETLGTQYYKLTMNATYINVNFAKFKYIMFSAMGSGANCIISTTPIEE